MAGAAAMARAIAAKSPLAVCGTKRVLLYQRRVVCGCLAWYNLGRMRHQARAAASSVWDDMCTLLCNCCGTHRRC